MGHQYVTTSHRWLQIPDEQLARYGAYDSLYTAQLVPHLLKELTRRGQTRYWNERFWPMVPVITTMQRRGVGDLDRELRNRARRWVRAAIDEVETTVWGYVSGGSGNYTRSTFFDSHKQLGRFLYGDLGLPRPPKTQKRADSSSSQDALLWVLAHLRKRDDGAVHVLHELFHRSRLATILERYLTIEGDPDGRVRPTIKMGAVETMRLAYAGETGEAVQQWPGEIRSLIRAKEGHTFVGRDFSQLEARILAILSNDSVSLQAFAAGRDVHSQNAIDLFGTGCQTVSKEGELVVPSTVRDYAKSFLYKLCLAGDTPIATLGPERSIPIKDIKVGEYVWTWGPTGYEHAQVTHHWNRGFQQCVKVTCRNRTGKYKSIICTPNHRFLMRDGTYKPASELAINESLMPFRRFNSGNYRQLDSQNNGGRVFEHIVVTRPPPDKHVHHINRDRHDNRPENLESHSPSEHRTAHKGDLVYWSEESREAQRQRAYAFIKDGRLDKMSEGRRKSTKWLDAVRASLKRRRDRERIENHVVTEVVHFGEVETFDIAVSRNSNFAIDNIVFVHNSYGGQPESDSRRLFCPCWRCTLKAPPTLDLPPSERKQAADRWEALHQPVLRWRDELLESVKGPGSNHTYVSPFGCHRVFMAPREEAKRSIYNYPLQHCASQIVNDVMMRLHNNHQAPITLQMHDSLTLEVPIDELNKWNDLLDLEMSKPVAELGGAVFPSKGGVGPTWGDLK